MFNPHPRVQNNNFPNAYDIRRRKANWMCLVLMALLVLLALLIFIRALIAIPVVEQVAVGEHPKDYYMRVSGFREEVNQSEKHSAGASSIGVDDNATDRPPDSTTTYSVPWKRKEVIDMHPEDSTEEPLSENSINNVAIDYFTPEPNKHAQSTIGIETDPTTTTPEGAVYPYSTIRTTISPPNAMDLLRQINNRTPPASRRKWVEFRKEKEKQLLEKALKEVKTDSDVSNSTVSIDKAGKSIDNQKSINTTQSAINSTPSEMNKGQTESYEEEEVTTLEDVLGTNELMKNLPMFRNAKDTFRPIRKRTRVKNTQFTLFPHSLKRPKYVVTDDNFDRLYRKMNATYFHTGKSSEVETIEVRKSPTGRGLSDGNYMDRRPFISSDEDDPFGEQNEGVTFSPEDQPFAVTEDLLEVLDPTASFTEIPYPSTTPASLLPSPANVYYSSTEVPYTTTSSETDFSAGSRPATQTPPYYPPRLLNSNTIPPPPPLDEDILRGATDVHDYDESIGNSVHGGIYGGISEKINARDTVSTTVAVEQNFDAEAALDIGDSSYENDRKYTSDPYGHVASHRIAPFVEEYEDVDYNSKSQTQSLPWSQSLKSEMLPMNRVDESDVEYDSGKHRYKVSATKFYNDRRITGGYGGETGAYSSETETKASSESDPTFNDPEFAMEAEFTRIKSLARDIRRQRSRETEKKKRVGRTKKTRKGRKHKARARGETLYPIARGGNVVPLPNEVASGEGDSSINVDDVRHTVDNNDTNIVAGPVGHREENGKQIEMRTTYFGGQPVKVELANPHLHGHDLIAYPGVVIHENITFPEALPSVRRRLFGSKILAEQMNEYDTQRRSQFVGQQPQQEVEPAVVPNDNELSDETNTVEHTLGTSSGASSTGPPVGDGNGQLLLFTPLSADTQLNRDLAKLSKYGHGKTIDVPASQFVGEIPAIYPSDACFRRYPNRTLIRVAPMERRIGITLIRCLRMCARNSACLSATYAKYLSICDIFNTKNGTGEAKTVALEGYTYYEPNSVEPLKCMREIRRRHRTFASTTSEREAFSDLANEPDIPSDQPLYIVDHDSATRRPKYARRLTTVEAATLHEVREPLGYDIDAGQIEGPYSRNHIELLGTTTSPVQITSRAQCGPDEEALFLRSQGFRNDFASNLDTVLNINEDECVSSCHANLAGYSDHFDCVTAQYENVNSVCTLSSDSLKNPLTPFHSSAFYEKICVSELTAKRCSGGTIERKRQQVLVGYVRDFSLEASVADCLAKCIAAEKTQGFRCLSFLYYFDDPDMNCVLNDASHVTHPNAVDSEDKSLVDYFGVDECYGLKELPVKKIPETTNSVDGQVTDEYTSTTVETVPEETTTTRTGYFKWKRTRLSRARS